MPRTFPPLAKVIAYLEEHGLPPESRPEATTEALVERYPELRDVAIDDLEVAGPHGPIPCRRYEGPDRSGPALVWMHGGAWIYGDLDMPEAHWVGLAIAAAGIPVLSVDYRKALGGVHHPVPLDDVLAAWEWAADALPGPLFLGGASAGANLAAGAAKRLRDDDGPQPAGLLLVYPSPHARLPAFSAELQRAMDSAPEDAVLFSHDDFFAFVRNHLGSDDLLDDPYAVPAEGNLAGLPRTYILNDEHDTVRSSGEAFAALLVDAGVDVRVEMEPGAHHGHLDRPLESAGSLSLERMVAWILEAT